MKRPHKKAPRPLDGIALLSISEDVVTLAQALVDRHAIPAVANANAVHVAVATVNGIHYLMTWNCKHIANAERFDAIATVCIDYGYKPPIICTPDELTGD